MYYHCRPLKYVEYGKVFPPPDKELWDFMVPAYRWLGNYCGYCPQVWLSRSHLSITGYKSFRMMKKRENVMRKRSETRDSNDSVLFGFDVIKGFPVDFGMWEFILMFMPDNSSSLEEKNKEIARELNEIVRECKADGIEEPVDREFVAWESCHGNIDLFLKKHLFVEKDQVVVPSLNLKVAKKIFCRDEKQKKKLRHMGFIEDRIEIKNMKSARW